MRYLFTNTLMELNLFVLELIITNFLEFETREEFMAVVNYLQSSAWPSVIAWIGGTYNGGLGKHIWSQTLDVPDSDLFVMGSHPTGGVGYDINLNMNLNCPANSDGALSASFSHTSYRALCEHFP